VILQEKCYVLKLCFQTNPPHWIAARSAVGQEPALGQKKENRKALQTRNPQCSNPAHAREKEILPKNRTKEQKQEHIQ